MTGRVTIASIAREAGVSYFRAWKAFASGGGWDGLTSAEADRLTAVLEKHGNGKLGVEATIASQESA